MKHSPSLHNYYVAIVFKQDKYPFIGPDESELSALEFKDYYKASLKYNTHQFSSTVPIKQSILDRMFELHVEFVEDAFFVY